MGKRENDTGVQIRPLGHIDEARACADLMAHSEPWITLRRSCEDSLKILCDPEREVYVAVAGDELVGFTILVMKGAFVGYIQSVAVWPEWRNRGIGSRLLAFAEDRILRETPNVFICTSSFNAKALRLYRRLGYEEIGELKDWVLTGYTEILMRKSIASLAEFQANE
jgi:ribosomal protein S18 acetylase RimI-like enzyme